MCSLQTSQDFQEPKNDKKIITRSCIRPTQQCFNVAFGQHNIIFLTIMQTHNVHEIFLLSRDNRAPVPDNNDTYH